MTEFKRLDSHFRLDSERSCQPLGQACEEASAAQHYKIVMKSRVPSRKSLIGSYSSASLQSIDSDAWNHDDHSFDLSPTGFNVHQQLNFNKNDSLLPVSLSIGLRAALFFSSLLLAGVFFSSFLLLFSPILIPALTILELFWAVWLWSCHIPCLARFPLKHSPGSPFFSPDQAFEAFISQASLLHRDGTRVVDSKKLISSWFFEAPFQSIRLGNLALCISHGFYFMPPAELKKTLGIDAMDLARRYTEAAGIKMAPGFREGLRTLVTTMCEPLKCGHRLACFYLSMELISVISSYYLQFVLGFTSVASKEKTSVRFFSRAASVDQEADQPPVLVMHGIGLGLLTYLPTLTSIVTEASGSNRSVLCLEIPHISMRFSLRDIPTIQKVAEDVVAGLMDLDQQKVSLLAHSYSTCVASYIINHHPDIVHTACLIDPVCFGSFLPPRPLTGQVRFSSFSDLVMDFFILMVIREPHQAATWYRRFYWPDGTVNHLTLFPCPTTFALGGKDVMIHNVSEVNAIIERTDCKVLVHPTHPHGGVLSDRKMQKELLEML